MDRIGHICPECTFTPNLRRMFRYVNYMRHIAHLSRISTSAHRMAALSTNAHSFANDRIESHIARYNEKLNRYHGIKGWVFRTLLTFQT